MAEFTGQSLAALIGRRFADLVHRDDVASSEELRDR